MVPNSDADCDDDSDLIFLGDFMNPVDREEQQSPNIFPQKGVYRMFIMREWSIWMKSRGLS